MGKNIAVDGPAGAGKSTIAKKVAKNLGLIYVDTGAMYRAIGLYMLRNNIDVSDEEAVNQACDQISVSIQYVNGEQQVLLNGENVNGFIRKEEVGNMASKTSSYPKVRAMLLDAQKELAQKQNVIMDGRDIGTCVLPDAELKIYLTASVQTRAKRRFDELVEKGVECDITEIEKDIEQRDYQDMNRTIAPLKQAQDAVLVDSSNLTIEQVCETIINLYEER
ncbi:(d)CMP kinase [Eubacterium oxidoreducens]|uniref:Cytidylate kinase n=1 Tax=Eubacterium oxidoreducens TaxID=1732 RepID=A0A1G6ANB8_EUBOX|nr:(d)CMP kinase [Eubacterium oxidoreducens]SDB09841.1 cytidylate kinase [Eubacterium oxidoreducens]